MRADASVREAVAPRLLAFWRFFQERAGAARGALTVRDLLAWAGFVGAAAPRVGALPAYAHGAHLALLDGVGLGLGVPQEVRARALLMMAAVYMCLPHCLLSWGAVRPSCVGWRRRIARGGCV